MTNIAVYCSSSLWDFTFQMDLVRGFFESLTQLVTFIYLKLLLNKNFNF